MTEQSLIGPCPECGSAYSYQGKHHRSGGQMVMCMHCGFTAIGTDRAKAIEQWNACGQRKKEKTVGSTPVPPGYALVHENALKAWGKLEEVKAACQFPVNNTPKMPKVTITMTIRATRPDGMTITSTEHTTDHESLPHAASQLARKFNNVYTA